MSEFAYRGKDMPVWYCMSFERLWTCEICSSAEIFPYWWSKLTLLASTRDVELHKMRKRFGRVSVSHVLACSAVIFPEFFEPVAPFITIIA